MSKKISKFILGLSLATTGGLSSAALASAINTEVSQCSTLPGTIAAASTGDTVTLGLGCTQHFVVASGQSLTFDLAGNQLSDYSGVNVITVAEGATLTLIDSIGGGVVKAGDPSYSAIVNYGTLNIKNLTIWGDIQNSGSLNLESVTLDPEDYYPYPTYVINNNGGTITTSGDSSKNLFKSTPIENLDGTVSLTAATFDSMPDEDLIAEGYEVVEVDGKFVIRLAATNNTDDNSNETPANTDENTNTNTDPVTEPENTTPEDQTSTENEAPVEPLGEVHTETGTTPVTTSTSSPAVPNTGDREEIVEKASSSNIDLILLLSALSFIALLTTVIVRSKKTANEKVAY